MTNNAKTQSDLIKDLNTHEKDPLLNLNTVAKALGKSPQTIAVWVNTGIIKTERVGPLPKIRKSVLEALLSGSMLGEDENTVMKVDALKG